MESMVVITILKLGRVLFQHPPLDSKLYSPFVLGNVFSLRFGKYRGLQLPGKGAGHWGEPAPPFLLSPVPAPGAPAELGRARVENYDRCPGGVQLDSRTGQTSYIYGKAVHLY